MADMEEVKIITQKKTWKLLMLGVSKALQLRKDHMGTPYVVSESLVCVSF